MLLPSFADMEMKSLLHIPLKKGGLNI